MISVSGSGALDFIFYYLHKPWSLPSILLSNLTHSCPARRFRRSWMSIIVHGRELTPTLVIVMAVILGLAG